MAPTLDLKELERRLRCACVRPKDQVPEARLGRYVDIGGGFLARRTCRCKGKGIDPDQVKLVPLGIDDLRHARARIGLMRELLFRDPSVRGLFGRWKADVAELGATVRDRIDEALEVRWPARWSRKDFFDGALDPRASVNPEDYQQPVAVAIEAVRNLENQLRKLRPKWEEQASTLVMKLNLGEVPWLAAELRVRGQRVVVEAVICQSCPIPGGYTLLPTPMPPAEAPHEEFRFRARAGETHEAFQRRVVSEIDVHWTHEAGGARRRRQPKGSRQLGYHGRPLGPAEFSSPVDVVAAVYEQYGCWLYRRRALEVSERQLAKEYHEVRHPHRPLVDCDDRPAIHKGVDAAARVLALPVALFF
jgi:hypothetical protein